MHCGKFHVLEYLSQSVSLRCAYSKRHKAYFESFPNNHLTPFTPSKEDSVKWIPE